MLLVYTDELRANDTKSTEGLIKEVTKYQLMMEEKMETQQLRLEESHSYITQAMSALDHANLKHETLVRDMRAVRASNLMAAKRHRNLAGECLELLTSLRELHRYCNETIKEENAVRASQDAAKVSLERLQSESRRYKKQSGSYLEQLRELSLFQSSNQTLINDSSELIDSVWRKVECSFTTWDANAVLQWIRHKMHWINADAVPNCVDFALIFNRLDEMQINGQTLLTLQKKDLLDIGFKLNSHRTNIHEHIRYLINSNRSDAQSMHMTLCDDDEPDVQEGQPSTHDKDQDVPQGFRCALSGELMTNPVICCHDMKVYEKNAIREYLMGSGGRLPDGTTADRINVDDQSSFLLFDELSIKNDTEQYRKERAEQHAHAQ